MGSLAANLCFAFAARVDCLGTAPNGRFRCIADSHQRDAGSSLSSGEPDSVATGASKNWAGYPHRVKNLRNVITVAYDAMMTS